jgi:preprotein translocase subunit SecA
VVRIFGELREESAHMYNDILRYFLLDSLDRCWKEHLRAMDYLREGIGLRGYAQRNPKHEYQSEGLRMFKELLFRIHEIAVTSLTHVRMRQADPEVQNLAEAEDGAVTMEVTETAVPTESSADEAKA